MTTTQNEKTFIYGPHMSSENAIEKYTELVFGKRRAIACKVSTPNGPEFQLVDGRRWYRVTVDNTYKGWNVEVASEG